MTTFFARVTEWPVRKARPNKVPGFRSRLVRNKGHLSGTIGTKPDRDGPSGSTTTRQTTSSFSPSGCMSSGPTTRSARSIRAGIFLSRSRRERTWVRRLRPGRSFGPFPPILALALALPTVAFANLQGIDRADNRIVFAGEPPGADREAHRHLRLEDTGGKRESYEAYWRARDRSVPLLRLRLHMQAPGHPFRAAKRKSLEHLIRTHVLFRRLAFAAVEAGTAESVLGPAEYLVFKAGRYRCGTWRHYLSGRADTGPGTLGDTLMTGLYCPASGEVDAARLTAVLTRAGIRGMAVPEADPIPDPSERSREDVLAELVRSGDMNGLRRIAARGGLDPDKIIPFSHPRFAHGRTLRRPMIMAASLFGHTEITVFLLDLGAATSGRAAGAICAAVARNHPDIAEVLLEADPTLAGHQRCGRDGRLSALEVARRLDREAIIELLRATQAR